MQDPNEDTEWNDILRAKGIIPEKPKEDVIPDDELLEIMRKAVNEKLGVKDLQDMTLDELDEMEDEEDERVLEEYRRQRLTEMRAAQSAAKFGQVIEITAVDYVKQINQADPQVWVVLHLYKAGIPLCSLINARMAELAAKFPATKFVKAISTTCIPNYPDRNVPTVFVYKGGDMKTQWVGPDSFGGSNVSANLFEFLIGKAGAVDTHIKMDPRRVRAQDVMMNSLGVRQDQDGASSSDDDDDDDGY